MPQCPSCRQDVQPTMDATGRKVCPACGWAPAQPSGMAQTPPASDPPAYGAPSRHPSAAPNAPGSVASMVLGIIAVVTVYFGIILGTLAIIFGVKARKRVRESQGALSGGGMAIAGIVMGIVSLAVLVVVVLGAVVFLLVADLAGEPVAEDTIILGPDTYFVQGFQLMGSDHKVTYTVTSDGAVLYAALVPLADANQPEPSGTQAWAERTGSDVTASATLPPGDYGLYFECPAGASDCKVSYTIMSEPV